MALSFFSASLHTKEFYTQSFGMALPLEISITSYYLQILLQWLAGEHFCLNSGYGKPFFSFHHSAKHAPLTFPQPNIGKMTIRAVL
jgi:hypothetical protein